MSFINDIAFDERVDELEVEGNLRVGGDILLHGEFPKMDQKIATTTNTLNSSISLKANQSDLDVVVVTLNIYSWRSTRRNTCRARLPPVRPRAVREPHDGAKRQRRALPGGSRPVAQKDRGNFERQFMLSTFSLSTR